MGVLTLRRGKYSPSSSPCGSSPSCGSSPPTSSSSSRRARGASPGKKIMKIRLIREETGLPLGLGMTLLRRICHGLDSAACGIGYLWPAWDAKGQTFADKVMRTVVVRTQ
ncbi:RDD family protein [Streptomyces chattanoogensis]|uniref:RDD family protein n=1 Tax=Streptomyces chattanoogensis TaxID=66876 RepID=UPI0036BEB88E